MSFVAFRGLLRRPLAPRLRRYATAPVIESSAKAPTAAESAYIAQLDAVEHHAVGTTDLWRKISLYVCVPAIIVCLAWVEKVESEHAKHIEHMKEEGTLPETPDYDYLNRRMKPFPWGPNSLFFNPHVNKDLSQ